jgi:hypothetical protein
MLWRKIKPDKGVRRHWEDEISQEQSKGNLNRNLKKAGGSLGKSTVSKVDSQYKDLEGKQETTVWFGLVWFFGSTGV